MKYKYLAVILAIKNDFCLEETIRELRNQDVADVLIISPRYYWSDHAPQSEADLEEIMAIARRGDASVVQADLLASHKTNQAIYTEALYRNYGGKLAAKRGAQYVLTVDADELWLPGTLEEIDALATAEPVTVCLPAIPVLGVPGLPVLGAKDTILVASAVDIRFEWGRATTGPRVMGTTPVLHFSATRRSLQEVIDKSRKSAHYPDPTYDFEGWIRDTLPQVRVGMKNVHMYKSPDNIWPEVRAWTQTELELIPTSLHPYLKR
jgi:hypothetical protein